MLVVYVWPISVSWALSHVMDLSMYLVASARAKIAIVALSIVMCASFDRPVCRVALLSIFVLPDVTPGQLAEQHV